jgi:hypothetical protein
MIEPRRVVRVVNGSGYGILIEWRGYISALFRVANATGEHMRCDIFP